MGEFLDESGFVNSNQMLAKQDTVLLQFNKDQFYELMADQVKLAERILEYV